VRNKRGMKIFGALAAGVLIAVSSVSAVRANPNDEWESLENQKLIASGVPAVLAISGTSPAPAGNNVVVWSYSYSPSVPQQLMGDQEWKAVWVDGATAVIWRNAGASAQYAMSIKNNSRSDGAQVVQWYYQPDNAFQKWRVHNIGAYHQYENVGAPGKCLAIAGAANGTYVARGDKVVIWNCGSAGPDQFWKTTNK
jgi:hypothetical protein